MKEQQDEKKHLFLSEIIMFFLLYHLLGSFLLVGIYDNLLHSFAISKQQPYKCRKRKLAFQKLA